MLEEREVGRLIFDAPILRSDVSFKANKFKTKSRRKLDSDSGNGSLFDW